MRSLGTAIDIGRLLRTLNDKLKNADFANS